MPGVAAAAAVVVVVVSCAGGGGIAALSAAAVGTADTERVTPVCTAYRSSALSVSGRSMRCPRDRTQTGTA